MGYMNKDIVSQEEIDVLLSKKALSKEQEESRDKEREVLGEIATIFMSRAAKTLSEILNKKVSISIEDVKSEKFKKFSDEISLPKLIASADYLTGIKGKNILILDTSSAAVISDIVVGGDGTVEDHSLSEVQESAIRETLEQMIKSATTAMALMTGKELETDSTRIRIVEENEDIEIDEFKEDTEICVANFNLLIDGVLDSQITHIVNREIADQLILDTEKRALDRSNREKKESKDKEVKKGTEISTKKNNSLTIQKPIFKDLEHGGQNEDAPRNLDLIMDVPLEFSVVLGKSKKTIREILSFGSGSVIELNKQADEALEIYVNGKLIAQGEVVVINENFGIRITNILSKEQRVKAL